MIRTTRICIFSRAAGEEVFVVDTSDGRFQSRWHAQRVINVLTDGPRGDQAFGSSPDAEAFVRRMMPQLSDYKWQSKELDW